MECRGHSRAEPRPARRRGVPYGYSINTRKKARSFLTGLKLCSYLPMLSNSSTISASGALVQRETTTMAMLDRMNAGMSS